MPSLSNNSTWVNTLLAVAAIGVFVLCVIGGYSAWEAAQNSEEIVKNAQIQHQVRTILAGLKDAETGQRGYLITGDESYLSLFHIGLNRSTENLASLHNHSVTGHLLPEKFASLQRLAEEKRQKLQDAIDARREGPEEEAFNKARDVVKTGQSKLLMEQIEALIGEILAAQDDELERREHLSNRLAGRHVATLAVGLVLTLGTFFAAAVVTHRETAERNRAVMKLRTERARHIAVIDASMDAVVAVDHEGKVVMLNPIAEILFKQRERDVVGRPFEQFVAEQYRSSFTEFIKPTATNVPARSNVAGGQIVYGVKSDGTQFPAEAVVSRAEIDGQLLFTVMLRDVTERETGRLRLREQTAILSRVRDSIHIRDLNDRILTWNDGAQTLFGWSAAEATGCYAASLLFGSSEQNELQIREELLANGTWSGERDVTTKDGRVRTIESRRSLIVDSAGQPASQLVIDIDTTDEKRRERLERRSQRLESIGTLTSGIAHDLNNILTPITMGARLLRNHYSDEKVTGLIDTIVSSADRGTGMIRQLLSFAGGASGPRKQVDMKSLIEETCAILRHTLTQKLSVRAEVDPQLRLVLADATELSQVLMNLAINARDAMPNGGELTFEASNVELKEKSVHVNLPRGRYVSVSVIDTGIGMSPEVTERIFDPFFTTKEQGKGTGLGLATCMGIVKSHAGGFAVYSEPGRGTKFTFYLPAYEGSTEELAKSAEKNLPEGNGHGILLIDDEESILQMAKMALEFHGFVVYTALGGAAGISVFRQHSNGIYAVVVDMMMPELDGSETIKALKSIRPNIPIVASSGLRRPEYGKGNMESTVAFLSKPYSDEQLLQAIQLAMKTTL